MKLCLLQKKQHQSFTAISLLLLLPQLRALCFYFTCSCWSSFLTSFYDDSYDPLREEPVVHSVLFFEAQNS